MFPPEVKGTLLQVPRRVVESISEKNEQALEMAQVVQKTSAWGNRVCRRIGAFVCHQNLATREYKGTGSAGIVAQLEPPARIEVVKDRVNRHQSWWLSESARILPPISDAADTLSSCETSSTMPSPLPLMQRVGMTVYRRGGVSVRWRVGCVGGHSRQLSIQ